MYRYNLLQEAQSSSQTSPQKAAIKTELQSWTAALWKVKNHTFYTKIWDWSTQKLASSKKREVLSNLF